METPELLTDDQDIRDTKLRMYVGGNGQRVLSGRGMQAALGMGQSHGTKFKAFLNHDVLKTFIPNDLAMELENPVKFIRQIL